MSKTLYFALALSFALVLTSVNANVAPYTTTAGDTNPFCSPPFSLTHAGQNQLTGGAEVVDFQYSSFLVRRDNGDSIPILAREPKDGKGFKWLGWTDSQFTTVVELQCTGTAADTYLKIYRNILILKKSDGSLAACDPSAAAGPITPLILSAFPSDLVTGTLTVTSAYYYADDKLFFLVSNGTRSAVYSYDLTDISPITATLEGALITAAIPSGRGNKDLLYNPADNTIYQRAGWVADTVMTGIASGKAVSHNYEYKVGILIFYDSAKTSVKVAGLSGITVTDLAYTQTSATPFNEYSDFQSGSLIIGADNMFWVYQPFYDSGNLWTLKVTAANLMSTGLTTSLIDHVTLSGDKAFFHYDGGKFMIWKMHQNGAAKIVYHANNSGIPTTGDMQYKVTLNCLCQALKRFFCSSATLACVIIKKGTDNCFNEDTLNRAGY